MSNSPILNAPPPWDQFAQTVELWHGCVKTDAETILANGIDVSRGNPATDFGRGFYTTTMRRQARHWAWWRAEGMMQAGHQNVRPVVIRFRVPTGGLAELNSLHFVVGEFSNERFWSLVHHCRGSSLGVVNNHLHPDPSRNGWYDMVVGPVAAFWQQRVAMTGADQYSFHTQTGGALLNEALRSSDSDRCRVYRVRAV